MYTLVRMFSEVKLTAPLKLNMDRGDRGYVGHGAIMDRAIKICKMR
jgi:hypothetical protein